VSLFPARLRLHVRKAAVAADEDVVVGGAEDATAAMIEAPRDAATGAGTDAAAEVAAAEIAIAGAVAVGAGRTAWCQIESRNPRRFGMSFARARRSSFR
jgi:hypothetical protein